MAYKCLKCGKIFDEPSEERELRGFVGGDYAYENMAFCPHCGGDFEETKKCELCGEEYGSDELHGGVCIHCINEKREDFDAIYNISIGENISVEINALLASLLDPADINEILRKHIRENMSNVDCSAYIDEDLDYIGEALAEGRDKL